MSEQPAPPQTDSERVQVIVDLLTNGCRRSAVPGYLRNDDGWNQTDAEIEALIVGAEETIIRDAQNECPGADLATALAVAQLRDTFAMCIRGGEAAGALAARKELTKLAGLGRTAAAPSRPPALPPLDNTQAHLVRLLEITAAPAPRRELISNGTDENDINAAAGNSGNTPADHRAGRRRELPGRAGHPE